MKLYINESVENKTFSGNIYRESKGSSDFERMLDTFDHNGRYAKRGRWSIGRGGYDEWFEIYKDNISVISCVAGQLENHGILSDDEFIKLANIIMAWHSGCYI